MKNLTAKEITYLVAIAILFAIGVWAFKNSIKPVETQYARTGFVVELDRENDIVVVEDWAGLTWEFYGIEDWEVNDIASMLMNDNGTPENIYDDEILSVRYGGQIN